MNLDAVQFRVTRNKFLVRSRGARHCTKRNKNQTGQDCGTHPYRSNLYDIADCELHAFVDSDAQENVQRLYWVQFEGYLPSKPDLAHQYDSPRHTTIGGLDFYVDTWVRPKDAKTQKGSDRQHIEE